MRKRKRTGQKKMKQTLKKIWNVVSTILVIVIVLCSVFLMGSRLIGYRVFNILTGSMAPQYNEGDLIYVKQVSPEEVQVGDPITFVLNEELVVATHRVVEIDSETSHFYTKGDANDIIDAPVHFKNLIGIRFSFLNQFFAQYIVFDCKYLYRKQSGIGTSVYGDSCNRYTCRHLHGRKKSVNTVEIV